LAGPDRGAFPEKFFKKPLYPQSDLKGMKEPEKTDSGKIMTAGPWAVLILVVLFVVVVRVGLLDVPLERDEGEYAYTAERILEGVLPYTESYDLKMPGLHAVYAVFLAVFGHTRAGIHSGLLVVSVATVLIVFFLARRLFDATAGAVASAAFAVMCLSQKVLGFTTNAEPLLLLPALGGVLLMLRAIESGRRAELFLSGLLLGAAFVIKQPALFFAAFAGLYLIFAHIQEGSLPWPERIRQYAVYSAGAAAPFAVACLVLAGVLSEFLFWTFSYSFAYGSAVPLHMGLVFLKEGLAGILSSQLLIWALAALGLSALAWDRRARSNGTFIVGFLLFSFLAVSVGLIYRKHYFILMLPAVSLLAGAGVSSLSRLFSGAGPALLRRTIPAAAAVIAILFAIYAERDYLFRMGPMEISRATYGPNPFIEAIEIGGYIKARTTPDEKIAVLGSEPEIYFYSNRRAATKYIVMYPLTGEHEYALKMQEELIGEIESARPAFLVIVNVPMSWSLQPDSKRLLFDWVEEYVPANYDRVGVVDIPANGRTLYRWGEESAGFTPRSIYSLSVYRRKGGG
jgi:hypothetical protein